jgi:hypothetical protein
MSEAQDFHKFIIGETRVDGFVSEWKRDFLAYMANKPAPRIMAPKVAAVVVKKPRGPKKDRRLEQNAYQRKRRLKLLAKGLCVDCGKHPSGEKNTVCPQCRVVRSARELGRYRRKKAA